MRFLSLPLVLLLSAPLLGGEPARDRFGDPLPSDAVTRLGGLHLRHPRPAVALAFAPDGKTLATAAVDGNVYFWDIQKRKLIRTLSADCPAGLSALRWPATSKGLYVAGRDGAIHFLHPEGRSPQRRLGKESIPLTGLDVSRDGTTAITVDQKGHVRIWNTGEDKPRREYAGLLDSSLAGLTPDGAQAVFADPEGILRLITVASGKEVRTFSAEAPPAGPRQPKRSRLGKMALSPDGKLLAYSDWRNRIHLHALESGEPVRLLDRMPGVIYGFVFSPNGQFLAVSTPAGVHIFGVTSGRELRVFEARLAAMSHLAFAPDGKTLAGLATDSGLYLWDVLEGRERFAPEGHSTAIEDLLFLPDGRRLVSHSTDGQLCLWDIPTERIRALSRGHTAYPRSLTASTDGGVVRLVGLDQGISSWDLTQDRNYRGYVPAKPPFGYAAVSPDGKTLAVFTHDRKLQLRQPGQSAHQTLDAPEAASHVLRFSPDSRLLADATNDGALRLRDRATGAVVRVLREPKPANIQWLEFAADGRTLLIWDGTLHVLETETGQERIDVKIKTADTAKAYSPDGRWAACGGADGSVHLYALANGREVAHFQGPQGGVGALAFSPDGRLLASAGADKAILLWKTPEGEFVRGKAAEMAGLWDDLVSEDGQRVHRAMTRLGADAEQAVPFLHERLRTQLKPMDGRRLAQLIRDLDSNDFAQREKASRELAEMGEVATAALHEALERGPSLEMRRRLRDLLKRVGKPRLSTESLHCLRAVEVLERIGTPQARQILADLGGKDIDTTLRKEIRASLQRLDQQR